MQEVSVGSLPRVCQLSLSLRIRVILFHQWVLIYIISSKGIIYLIQALKGFPQFSKFVCLWWFSVCIFYFLKKFAKSLCIDKLSVLFFKCKILLIFHIETYWKHSIQRRYKLIRKYSHSCIHRILSNMSTLTNVLYIIKKKVFVKF